MLQKKVPFRVLWCINEYVVHFVGGRLPNLSTHQWGSKFIFTFICVFPFQSLTWVSFRKLILTISREEERFKGLEALGFFLLKALRAMRAQPSTYFSREEKHKRLVNPKFFAFFFIVTGRGTQACHFIWRNKKTWGLEALGSILVESFKSWGPNALGFLLEGVRRLGVSKPWVFLLVERFKTWGCLAFIIFLNEHSRFASPRFFSTSSVVASWSVQPLVIFSTKTRRSKAWKLQFFGGIECFTSQGHSILDFLLDNTTSTWGSQALGSFQFMCCNKPRRLAFGFLHDGGKNTFSREGFFDS